MADDYARHALSQRAAFAATQPAVMAAAQRLADEPVLRVADLGAADTRGVVVIPRQGDAGPGAADTGTGAHYASAEAHGDACRRALEHDPPPATVISMAGIPLQQAPCLPSGTVHVAVTGTAMHWVADAAGLASSGSVFPGYPDHVDAAERRAWRVAAARQWERLLEMRAIELAPGGRFMSPTIST